MLSIKDFIAKYEHYSGEELFEINSSIDNYSNEAKEALAIVLNKKGGIQKVEKRLLGKQLINQEIKKVKIEVDKLSSRETNPDFIKTLVSSDILTKEQVDKIIDLRFAEHMAFRKSNSVNTRTILFASLGILTSCIPAGILWSWLVTNPTEFLFFWCSCGVLLLLYNNLVYKKS